MYACDATVAKAPEARVTEETPDKVTLSLDGKWTVSFAKTNDAAYTITEKGAATESTGASTAK